MRLSALKSDPAYDAKVVCHATIYLNDQPVDLCVLADEERGYVERYVLEDGKLALGEDRYPLVEVISGKVRIEVGGSRPGVQVAYPEDAAL